MPAERVAPFFPLLSAHLSCAMTHIDTGIQEDAMKILDVLLEHYPALLAARPEVLLTNFLELISHRQNSGGNKKVQDPKGRTWALSVNPSRAVTSQQWRLSVLLRYVGSICVYITNRFLWSLFSSCLSSVLCLKAWTISAGGSRGKTSWGKWYFRPSWRSVWLQRWG